MNGPQHYRRAEELLAAAERYDPDVRSNVMDFVNAHIALAQVAATAANIRRNALVPIESAQDWAAVIR